MVANWVDILAQETALKEQYREKIERIACFLSENIHRVESNGLLTGKMGVSLFFYHSFLLTGDTRYFDICNQVLEDTIVSLGQNNPPTSSHCDGTSGIAWAFDYLFEKKSIDFNANAIWGKHLDEILIRDARTELTNGNIDFLHGSSGILYYLLEKQHTGIQNVLQAFIEKGSKDQDYFYWKTPVFNMRQNAVNLSLSHGNTGLLFVLLKAYSKGAITDDNLIRGLIKFILSSEITGGAQGNRFPDFRDIHTGPVQTKNRLAWCYGDLGLCYALFTSGKILNDPFLIEKSIELFKVNSVRKEFPETGIRDANFCHGTIGVAHMYNRVFQQTNDPVFKETAIYWYKNTVAFSTNKDEFAGFRTFVEPDMYKGTFPLLNGIAGIGLSMISAISEIEPDWDRFLFLS
jgi:lantibiotic modifying enzyme